MYACYPVGGYPTGGLFSIFEEILKMLSIYYRNILESGTTTVTSEDSDYPKYRLYDRNIGLLFKFSSISSPQCIYVDQGTLEQFPIDTLIIPSGHNLAGLNLQLIYSNDCITWPQALAWIGTSGLIKKEFSTILARYWAFRIFSPASPPELHELFLTSRCDLERGPSWKYELGKQENITRLESKSGLVQKTKWGNERQIRDYPFEKISEAQRLTLDTIRTELNGVKNFYFEDLEGTLFFAEFPEGIPSFSAEPIGRWGHRLRIREVLP